MKPKHLSLKPLVVSLGACGILFSGNGVHAQETPADDGAIRVTSDESEAIRVTSDGDTGSGLTVKAATLPEISVTDRSRDVNQVTGYVPTSTSAGTRTETPITDIPRSISVIGAQQIQDQGSRSLGDAMRYMPGVQANHFGADPFGEWINMRGFSTRAFQDGIPDIESNPEKGDVRDDPFVYERMEVLRGPSAAVSGNNSPGGVIHMVSKRPQATPFGEVNLSYGSYDTKLLSLDSTGPLDKDGQWLYRVLALGSKGGAQVDHAKSERGLFKPMLTWVPTARTNVTVFAEYQRDYNNTVLGYLPKWGTLFDRAPGKLDPRLFISEPDWDRARGIRKRAGWEVNQQLSDNWSLRHHLRYSKSERDLRSIFPDYPDVKEEVWTDEEGNTDAEAGQYMLRKYTFEAGHRNTLTADLLFQGRFNTGSMKHTALIAFDMNNIRSSDKGSDGEVSSLNAYNPVYGNFEAPDLSELNPTTKKFRFYGITLQDQVKVTDALTVAATLRYDKAEQRRTNAWLEEGEAPTQKQKNDNLAPSVGVMWDIGGGVKPYISYSESFQVEGIYGSQKVDGSFLKPETAKQTEVGVKWQSADKRVLLTGGVFDIKMNDRIVADPVNDGYFIQAGKQKASGLELESSFNLRSWNLIAQYTYVKNQFRAPFTNAEDLVGVQLPGVPKHAASAWATYRFSDFGLPNLRAGAGILYRGKTEDGSNVTRDSVPSVTTGDLMASYEFDNVTFSLNVNNVADKKFLAYCAADGDCGWGARRNIMGTLTYRW